MIQFENIQFTYAGTVANEIGVKDIDFTIQTGECVFRCGRSVCGITSLTILIN